MRYLHFYHYAVVLILILLLGMIYLQVVPLYFIQVFPSMRGLSTKKILKATSPLPCNCVVDDDKWEKPNHKIDKCFFFDFGVEAAQSTLAFYGESNWESCRFSAEYDWVGKTEAWLEKICYKQTNKVRKIFSTSIWSMLNQKGYARHQCTSILVEPSKLANNMLQKVAKEYSQIQVFPEMAILHCDHDKLPFNIDGKTALTDSTSSSSFVEARNIIRLLAENVRSGDYVIVKMDIEGLEYDLLPCIAASPHAQLIDQILLERHDQWVPDNKVQNLVEAIQVLRKKGITIRDDWP